MNLQFDVLGKPQPKGSLRIQGRRGRRGRLVEDNEQTEPWREAVKWAALRAVQHWGRAAGEPWTALDGPVEVEVVFSFDRPASAPKRRETWPITRSTYDTDKLQRCIGDALQDAHVVVDDARIVRWVATKAYCMQPPSSMPIPGARIIVRPYRTGGMRDVELGRDS